MGLCQSPTFISSPSEQLFGAQGSGTCPPPCPVTHFRRDGHPQGCPELQLPPRAPHLGCVRDPFGCLWRGVAGAGSARSCPTLPPCPALGVSSSLKSQTHFSRLYFGPCQRLCLGDAAGREPSVRCRCRSAPLPCCPQHPTPGMGTGVAPASCHCSPGGLMAPGSVALPSTGRPQHVPPCLSPQPACGVRGSAGGRRRVPSCGAGREGASAVPGSDPP